MSGIISDEALLEIERARSSAVNWLRRIGYNISLDATWETINTVVSQQKDNLVARQILNQTIEEYIDTELTSLKASAFSGCSALRKLEIPNVKTIGQSAFANVNALQYPLILNTTITTLAGLTNMGSEVPIILTNALVNWYASKSGVKGILDHQGQSLSNYSLPSDIFAGYQGKIIIIRDENRIGTLGSSSYIPNTIEEIYVPHDLVNTYKTATNWSAHESKIKDLQGSDYESLTWYENWTPNE